MCSTCLIMRRKITLKPSRGGGKEQRGLGAPWTPELLQDIPLSPSHVEDGHFCWNSEKQGWCYPNASVGTLRLHVAVLGLWNCSGNSHSSWLVLRSQPRRSVGSLCSPRVDVEMCASRPILLADFCEVWTWDAAHTAQDKYFKQAWVKQHIFI